MATEGKEEFSATGTGRWVSEMMGTYINFFSNGSSLK
jgi:hypothetical protein